MPHLEHDMDELFQKAAENYPLKSGESNWETITGRLKNRPKGINETGSADRRKKYLFALLFLLVSLLLTNIILIQKNRGNNVGNVNSGKEETDRPNRQTYAIPFAVEKKITTKNPLPFSELEYYKDHATENHLSETKNEITPENENPFRQPGKIENEILEPINITWPYVLSIKNRNTPVLDIRNTTGPVKEKRFYWGILAGPQLNEVKQQGVQHTDVEAGILVGYRINKKMAVESGLFYGEKCYYSDAKYFKMSPDPSMPASFVLMDLEGKSNVIGIPLKLRYDLVNKRNNKFFTTAGFSSYLLTKENNNYHAMVNGSENYMEKSYNKNSCYAAANVNVSAGFEHRIMKDNFIRVEPYLQIPIKGIGVGSMPVTSAGIHIGIITNKRKR